MLFDFLYNSYLVFDNGGAAGFGLPNPGAPDGTWNALRDYSRVLEIDPTTLEIVWKYTARIAGYPAFGVRHEVL